MLRRMLTVFVGWCALSGLAGPRSAQAQLPTSSLSRIHPPAARVGESRSVTITGQNLDNVAELRFTHPGIVAQPVSIPGDDFLPERLKANTFEVTVGEDVPPGIYEARAVGFYGLSTARPFVVAPQESLEISESGDHSTLEQALPIELNSVVFGAVAASGIDWYRLHAPAGRRVLIEVQAERIDSRLDGLLVLYDKDGREVARNQDHFGRDPLLEIRSDIDADYFLAVSDVLYRGGAEHFYRLHLSDGPLVDFVFPPSGQPGSKGRYTIYGRNLPEGQLSGVTLSDGTPLEAVEVEIELPADDGTPPGYHPGTPRQGLLPGFDFSYRNANAVRIGFATSPTIAEESASDVQRVTVPVEVAGRFDTDNDEDAYRFTTEKGKSYAIEVIADRMASAVDPYLIVHRITRSESGGEQFVKVADNDDMTTFFGVASMESINADTKDAALVFTAEEGGEYAVTVVNLFGSGGAELIYRLAIREPLADFGLIATTEITLPTNRTGFSVTPHLRQGANWAIRILAPRQDEFEGDIVITAHDLPEGVTAEPLVLSGRVDRGFLVVSADESAPAWSGPIRIVGHANIGGREIVREARFAALIWGHVFADSIRVRSRLTTEVPLSVNGDERAPVVIEPANNEPLSVELGQELELPIRVTDSGSRKGGLTVSVDGLYGIHRNPPKINVAEKASEGTLTLSFKKNGNFDAAIGTYQFALKGIGTTKFRHNLPASNHADADLNRVQELLAAAQAEAERARQLLEQAQAAVKMTEEELANSDEDAKEELKKKLAEAKIRLQSADASARQATDKVARGEKAQVEAERIAKSAEARAKESTEKFAAWSKLITVLVTEPAKK